MLVNDARCWMNIISEIERDIIPVQWISFSFSVSWRAIFPAVFSVMTCNMSGDDAVSECNENEWLCWVSRGDKIWISSTPGLSIRVHSPRLSRPCSGGRWPRPGPRLLSPHAKCSPREDIGKYHCRFDSKLHKYPETITSFSFHLPWMRSKNSIIFVDL